MCGRYTLTGDGRELWELMELSLPASVRGNLSGDQVTKAMSAKGRRQYNIVPTSVEPVLLSREGLAELTPAHWWLLPAWGADQVTWRISKAGEKSFAWKGAHKSHFNSRSTVFSGYAYARNSCRLCDLL